MKSIMVQCPGCAYGPCCLLNLIKNGVYILVEVSFYMEYIALSNSNVNELRSMKLFWGQPQPTLLGSSLFYIIHIFATLPY